MITINEGSEAGDLKRLVIPNIELDVYQSKMGNDNDICVGCFTVRGKEPATNLVNFIEKGYNFVLDADCASGENNNGDYLVFVEFERSPAVVNYLIDIIDDICNLTEQKLRDWTFTYFKDSIKKKLTDNELKKYVKLTADEYKKLILDSNEEITALKSAAGLNTDKKAPKNEHTDSIRIAAGLL